MHLPGADVSEGLPGRSEEDLPVETAFPAPAEHEFGGLRPLCGQSIIILRVGQMSRRERRELNGSPPDGEDPLG